jgi:hypothetical protein
MAGAKSRFAAPGYGAQLSWGFLSVGQFRKKWSPLQPKLRSSDSGASLLSSTFFVRSL